MVVAQRLGHRDAMVTATIYAHVSNQQAETARIWIYYDQLWVIRN